MRNHFLFAPCPFQPIMVKMDERAEVTESGSTAWEGGCGDALSNLLHLLGQTAAPPARPPPARSGHSSCRACLRHFRISLFRTRGGGANPGRRPVVLTGDHEHRRLRRLLPQDPRRALSCRGSADVRRHRHPRLSPLGGLLRPGAQPEPKTQRDGRHEAEESSHRHQCPLGEQGRGGHPRAAARPDHRRRPRSGHHRRRPRGTAPGLRWP